MKTRRRVSQAIHEKTRDSGLLNQPLELSPKAACDLKTHLASRRYIPPMIAATPITCSKVIGSLKKTLAKRKTNKILRDSDKGYTSESELRLIKNIQARNPAP